MRRSASFLLLLLPLFAFSQKFHDLAFPVDYVPFAKDTLTVLSWNVEHFVDGYDNPYIRNRMEDQPDADKVQKKVDFLADVIQKSGADVVVLQEFESQSFAFNIIQQKMAADGFRYVAGSESPDWYMNVVILSKLPIGMVYSYGNVYTEVPGFTDSLGRQETQRHINTRMCTAEIWVNPSYSFMLTGVHLKAGRYERDTAMRLGQIDLLLSQNNRFLKEDKKTRLMLAGDCNMVPGSPEMARMTEKGKPGFIDPLAADTLVYSHPAEKPQRRLDHIFMNKSMQKSLVPGSVHPFQPYSGEMMRTESDHLPMRAKFIVR